MTTPTTHASAVLIGTHAALIRGPSGAGKSRLAFDLIRLAGHGGIPFARLVADDRAVMEARNGRLLIRPAPALAGLIEIRGLGIRRLPYEPVAVAGLVIDLAASDSERLPAPEAGRTVVSGIELPRLAVAPDSDAVTLIRAWQASTAATGG